VQRSQVSKIRYTGLVDPHHAQPQLREDLPQLRFMAISLSCSTGPGPLESTRRSPRKRTVST
jgi:hypothetical protein